MAKRNKTNSTGVFFFYDGGKPELDKHKTYYVAYKTKAGKRVEKKVGRHSEGMRVAKAALMRGDFIQQDKFGIPLKEKTAKDEVITLNEVFDYYISKKKMAKVGNAKYKKRWDYDFRDTIGTKEVNKITTDDLSNFRDGLHRLSLRSQEMYLMMIASAIKFCTSLDLEETKKYRNLTNPVPRLFANDRITSTPQQFKKDHDNKRDRWLSLSEVKLLREACEPKLLLSVEILLSTGCRATASTQILKRDVDLENGTITINDEKSVSTYTGYITPQLRVLLEKRLEEIGDADRVSYHDYNYTYRKYIVIANKLFNTDANGDVIKDRKQKVVLHTLRHTFASLLAKNSVPVNQIQKLMNHADITMTMRYAKLSPDAGKDKIISLYGGV